jgi:hypothetical protein
MPKIRGSSLDVVENYLEVVQVGVVDDERLFTMSWASWKLEQQCHPLALEAKPLLVSRVVVLEAELEVELEVELEAKVEAAHLHHHLPHQKLFYNNIPIPFATPCPPMNHNPTEDTCL